MLAWRYVVRQDGRRGVGRYFPSTRFALNSAGIGALFASTGKVDGARPIFAATQPDEFVRVKNPSGQAHFHSACASPQAGKVIVGRPGVEASIGSSTADMARR
jgi:hypothetical protein